MATTLIEALAETFPNAQIDFVLRKGNQSLLANNPHLNTIYIWNKKEGKYKDLYRILKALRKEKYDHVINLQRFGATGLLTGLSGAKEKVGFKKNPFSLLFSRKVEHEIGNGKHEVERNFKLIEHLAPTPHLRPKLYPSPADVEAVKEYQQTPYICIAPTSVWYTKQWLDEKWIKLINLVPHGTKVYLLGGPDDANACESIRARATNKNSESLAGKLNFLQSAALMAGAKRNYVNDSAPQHIASAMNAPVTAIFCSTVPNFGFGPLSDDSRIVETQEPLACRPCGLHGYRSCPEKHFKCATTIAPEAAISDVIAPPGVQN